MLSCLLLASTGCAWHLDPSLDTSQTQTISIPYVEGDATGELTSNLVREMEKQGGFAYRSDETGTLALKVRLLDDTYENIGFRFDPEKLHHHKKKLIPNETRQKDLAEVSVIDTTTGKVLLGPAYILSCVDYDHQNYSLNNDINVFSLGQLSDIDTAIDALDTPRYQHLAREITQYLGNHFDKLKQQQM